MPKIAIAVGEASGDIHAANLIAAIRELCPDAKVWGIGGERLKNAGTEIIFPCDRLSAMGLVEVIGKLPDLKAARNEVVKRFAQDPPDIFIPVDFAGFNLKLAAEAKRFGIPVIYFIPPKVWAWGGWRAKKVRRLVDQLLVILPFEEEFWRGKGVECSYVGSPVLDHLTERAFESEPDLIGLLPGSRMGEVTRLWPLMMEVAQKMAATRPLRFLAPRAEGLPLDSLKIPEGSGISLEVIDGRAQEVMERSSFCIVASGTATLECALIGTPMIAVYRANPISYAIGRRIVTTRFVALPNIIADREVIPELLTEGADVVARRSLELIDDGPLRREMLEGLSHVRVLMGEPGASKNAARIIIERLKELAQPENTDETPATSPVTEHRK
jgi:lipid-A-disaccharide synthase